MSAFFSCCVSTFKETEVSSGSMKRSVSIVGDERVNGVWEEEKSPERLYRPRHKSYKAAGWSADLLLPRLCVWFNSNSH